MSSAPQTLDEKLAGFADNAVLTAWTVGERFFQNNPDIVAESKWAVVRGHDKVHRVRQVHDFSLPKEAPAQIDFINKMIGDREKPDLVVLGHVFRKSIFATEQEAQQRIKTSEYTLENVAYMLGL